ncbi:VOC family protein [Nocardioides zeae]|uniref:Enzyme related to lactoylglutathione lyase n=1 Tax=Nocardioides zeae TaxID=1457234 RepID=A0AAJ1TX51_9ACTN|nr:VOC family protein [Nocardioides zeae]MDQ1103610.1 putative enzyme related to lactoylglutathione lyase [Nocardioides zeae]
MAVALSFASILAHDVARLSAFYEEVFALTEVHELTSPHFRGLWIGETVLGFSAPSAYDLLELPAPVGDDPGVRTFLTFEAASSAEVATYVDRAVALGGTLVQPPHDTYYGAWQAVLLDPEGHAFRVNHLPLARP